MSFDPIGVRVQQSWTTAVANLFHQLAGLLEEQINALSSAQVKALSSAQLAQMSDVQIQAMDAAAVAAQILGYTWAMVAASWVLVPVANMSGYYLAASSVLGALFLGQAYASASCC